MKTCTCPHCGELHQITEPTGTTEPVYRADRVEQIKICPVVGKLYSYRWKDRNGPCTVTKLGSTAHVLVRENHVLLR